MPVIRIETLVDAPVKVCFDLSRSIDLHTISTAHTGETAIAGVTSGLIKLNQTVTWRAKHFGIWQTLTSKITAIKEPVYFKDEMVKGVFKRFTHEHHFKTMAGKTLMTDIFDYTSPGGILGKSIDWLILEKYIRNLLVVRNESIKEYAESGKWQEIM